MHTAPPPDPFVAIAFGLAEPREPDDEQRRADAIARDLWLRGEAAGDPYQVSAGVPGDAMTEAPARREEGESDAAG